MKPLHHKTAFWIRKGVFDDLCTFADFEKRVDQIPEEKDRGDIFEIFIEGYLATQPISQRAKHWVVGRIPLAMREQYNLPRDATGIDGIYETHSGSQVAYQVKYRQRGQLTFAEVAPFLGITEKFTERVIFTNATRLSHKAVARKALDLTQVGAFDAASIEKSTREVRLCEIRPVEQGARKQCPVRTISNCPLAVDQLLARAKVGTASS